MKVVEQVKRVTADVSEWAGAKVVAVVALGTAAAAAHADTTIDTSAATSGITAAQTALLVVIGAMTTFAVAIWAAKKIPNFFGGGR